MSSGAANFPLLQKDEELPTLIYLSTFRHQLQAGIDLLWFFNLLMLHCVSVTLSLQPLPCLQMTAAPSLLLTLTVVGISYQSSSLFL